MMKQRIKIDKPPEWGYIETVAAFEVYARDVYDPSGFRIVGVEIEARKNGKRFVSRTCAPNRYRPEYSAMAAELRAYSAAMEPRNG
jgi:hypothetical protein